MSLPEGPASRQPPLPPEKSSINDRIREEERVSLIALIQAINQRVTPENMREFSELMRTSILADEAFIEIFNKNRFTISNENFQQLLSAVDAQEVFLNTNVAASDNRLKPNKLNDKTEQEKNFFNQLKTSNEKALTRFLGRKVYLLTFNRPLNRAPEPPPLPQDDQELARLFVQVELTPLKDSKQSERKSSSPKQRPRRLPPPPPPPQDLQAVVPPPPPKFKPLLPM